MSDLESNYDEYENKYRAVLLGLELSTGMQFDIARLFDLCGSHPSDQRARKNFLRDWKQLDGKFDNFELFCLLLGTMSNQDVNAFIESFYWEAWK